MFHWADYLLCSLSLLLSVGVGIFYGYKDRDNKQNTAEEFMVAGRSLKVLPVALSIFVSWVSAISFMGDPVEVYYNGAVYIYIGIGYILPLPLVAHIFAPALNSSRVISIYELLDTRYNYVIRLLASAANIIVACMYLGMVTYAPAVALSHVSGLPDWCSILLVGSIGTFYAILGGIKAVVWADALQSAIMFTGVLAVIIQGLVTVGGFQTVWDIADRGQRLNLNQNSWLPVGRSIWLYVVGGMFRVLVPFVSVQGIAQRYLALPSGRAAMIAIYLNIPMFIIFVSTFTLMGLIMFVHYEGCDPLESGRIQHADQLVPLFVLDMLGFIPGLPGLFLASLFAASLSTISSFVNSSATNVAKDFIEPAYLRVKGKQLIDRVTTRIAKLMTLLFGIMVILLALVALNVKSNIFPLTFKIVGLASGPIGSLFICAICMKFVKPWSVFLAAITGMFVTSWIGVGSFFYPSPSDRLPVTAYDCITNSTEVSKYDNMSSITVTERSTTQYTTSTLTQDDNDFHVYQISPMLYQALACTFTCLLAVIFTAVSTVFSRIFSKTSKNTKFELLPTKNLDKPQIPNYD